MEEKKGKRWNACWPDETDLTALKSLAHTFLYLEIQPTKMSPLVVKHPFTDSGITVIRDKNNSIQPADLLNDPRALDCWRGQMAQNIQEAESSNQLFYMVTKSYRLAFLKHTAGYTYITEQKCIGDFVCSLYQNLYRWFSRILQRRLPLSSRGPVRKVFRQSDIRFSRNK